MAIAQSGDVDLILPCITKWWLPFSPLQDFVSCIENYRRKGQELYASLYRDYVQVRNEAILQLPWIKRKKGKEKEEREPGVFEVLELKSRQWWVQVSWLAQWAWCPQLSSKRGLVLLLFTLRAMHHAEGGHWELRVPQTLLRAASAIIKHWTGSHVRMASLQGGDSYYTTSPTQ